MECHKVFIGGFNVIPRTKWGPRADRYGVKKHNKYPLNGRKYIGNSGCFTPISGVMGPYL